jgi:hypothetical protein
VESSKNNIMDDKLNNKFEEKTKNDNKAEELSDKTNGRNVISEIGNCYWYVYI